MCRPTTTYSLFFDFAIEAQGHQYELSFPKLAAGKSSINNVSVKGLKPGRFIGGDRTFFCSELAAKMCKVTGIIQNDDRSCTSFYPKHFSSKYDDYLRIEHGVSIESEVEILIL